jgi:preprotein translocase subunit SecG
MGQVAELDEDLDRLVRSAGRAPIGASAAVSSGAAAIIGIDWKYSGEPTVLAYLAAGLIAIFVALALLMIGLRLRRDTVAYAHEQQQQRQELERLRQENAALKARNAELEAWHRAASGRRRPGQSTSKGRALTPVESIEGRPS